LSSLVSYELDGRVATITMDDGKVNVLSNDMLGALNDALDRAVSDSAVVVLTGRRGVFSAGFDLGVLKAGGGAAADMLLAGFELSERLLAFPLPVVIACSGHTVAMGVFLLLSGDFRIGADDDYKIVANEVAIGLTMPHTAIEICRQRLTPTCFQRAVINAETFWPATAVSAGFLDTLVPPPELLEAAHETARNLAKLDMAAHAATKRRARSAALDAIRGAIDADDAALRALL
jgi:enoyl-CoA hydratase